MKMKNKVLGILVTLIIMIGMMVGQVNAATLNASAAEVNKGDRVTVTVNLENETQAVDVVLKYDANKFEYVKGSISSSLGGLTVNDTIPGEVRLSAANAMASTKSVSYTFIAKETTEGAAFTASGLVTESGETFTVDNVTVKVVEPTTENPEQPEQPENPGQGETPTTGEEGNTTTNNGQTASEEKTDAPKVDENGNVITKLPQTGTSIVTVVGIVAVAAIVAVLAVRKLRK